MTHRRRELTLVVLASLLWISACAGGGDGAAGDDLETADGFVVAFGDAYCDNVGDCCLDALGDFDRQECARNIVAGLASDLPLLRYEVRYDPEAARACIEAVGHAAAACASFNLLAEPLAVCGRVYEGQLAVGATCQLDEECASVTGARLRCIGTSASPDKVCVVERTALGLHEPCTLEDGSTEIRKCAWSKGLICDPASLTCEPGPAPGEPCNVGRCAPQDFCDFATDTCMQFPAPGMPCREASMECAIGAFCNEGICEKSSSDPDVSCESHENCPSGYCALGSLTCQDPPSVVDDTVCGLRTPSPNE